MSDTGETGDSGRQSAVALFRKQFCGSNVWRQSASQVLKDWSLLLPPPIGTTSGTGRTANRVRIGGKDTDCRVNVLLSCRRGAPAHGCNGLPTANQMARPIAIKTAMYGIAARIG